MVWVSTWRAMVCMAAFLAFGVGLICLVRHSHPGEPPPWWYPVGYFAGVSLGAAWGHLTKRWVVRSGRSA